MSNRSKTGRKKRRLDPILAILRETNPRLAQTWAQMRHVPRTTYSQDLDQRMAAANGRSQAKKLSH